MDGITDDHSHGGVFPFVHKALVKLDQLKGKIHHSLQIGISGPIVIQCKFQTERVHGEYICLDCIMNKIGGGLRDLEVNVLRLDPAVLQDIVDLGRNVVSHTLNGGEVDLHITEPKLFHILTGDKFTDILNNELPDLMDGAAFLSRRNEDARRNHAVVLIEKTDQGFRTGEPLFLHVVDRLIIHHKTVIDDPVADDLIDVVLHLELFLRCDLGEDNHLIIGNVVVEGIGKCDQVIPVIDIRGCPDDTYTGIHVQIQMTGVERGLHDVEDPLCLGISKFLSCLSVYQDGIQTIIEVVDLMEETV